MKRGKQTTIGNNMASFSYQLYFAECDTADARQKSRADSSNCQVRCGTKLTTCGWPFEQLL